MTSECLYQHLSLSLSELYIRWFVSRHETVLEQPVSREESVHLSCTQGMTWGICTKISFSAICPCESIKQLQCKATINAIFPSRICLNYIQLLATSSRFCLQKSVLVTQTKLATLFISCKCITPHLPLLHMSQRTN